MDPILYLDFSVPDTDFCRRFRSAVGLPPYVDAVLRIGEDSRTSADIEAGRGRSLASHTRPPGAIADIGAQLRLMNAAASRQGRRAGLGVHCFADPQEAPDGNISLLHPPYLLVAEDETFLPLGLAATLMVALQHIESRDDTVCPLHGQEHPVYRTFLSMRDAVAQMPSWPSPDAWDVIGALHPGAARVAEMIYDPRADLPSLHALMPTLRHGRFPSSAAITRHHGGAPSPSP